jgi:hypothetical protein
MTSESHPLWMICSWAHLPSSHETILAYAFSNLTKVWESGCTPSCCILLKYFQCLPPSFAFSHVPISGRTKVTTSQDGILLNTHQASSTLPHFAYMSTRLHPKRHQTQNHFEWSVHEHGCHLEVLLNQKMLYHWNKSGFVGIHSCCIWWKKLHHLFRLPVLDIFHKLLAPWKMFNCTVPGTITSISAAPMVGVISCQARELAVSSYVSSYVWILVTFHFPTTRNPYQADQPWIFHIPGINAIVWAQNATPTFSISKWILLQHIAFSHLLQSTITKPLVQRIQKVFLPESRPWQDSNHEREKQDWNQQELWLQIDIWCSVTFSDLWSYHCKGSKKNSHHSFSLSSPGTAEKPPIKSCTLRT